MNKGAINAVSKAIKEAIQSARNVDGELGDYLHEHVIRRDNGYVYEPDERGLPWNVNDE